MKRPLVAIALVGLIVAGCASSSDSHESNVPSEIVGAGDGAPSPIDAGDVIGDGTPESDPPAISPLLTSEIDRAVADLGTHSGVDPVNIVVNVAHELTWTDGSLGCPKPGMMYMQTLVEGYRIVLTDGTTVFEYHGATGEAPSLCEDTVGSG